MIGSCPAPVADAAYVRDMVAFIDCHALSIGRDGYRALSAPGSGLSLAITSLFTIMVALIGYRMLMGDRPMLRDALLALVKIGVVLALATGWPAYRVLFYDVAMRAPADLAATIGAPARLPGTDGGLALRLQAIDTALSRLATTVAAADDGTAASPQAPEPARTAPVAASTEATVMLGRARLVLLVTALGSLAATRLVAGILLAVGPIFIACLVLRASRGLFVGWLRVLGGAALGALGAGLMLGIAMAAIEPMVMGLARRAADGPIAGDGVVWLFATVLVFAITTLAMLIGAARVMAGLQWPSTRWTASASEIPADRSPGAAPAGLSPPSQPAGVGRSRAAITADAIAGQQRRGSPGDPRHGAGSVAGASALGRARDGGDGGSGGPEPLGQSFRRTRSRVSGGMTRRNAS